MMDKKKTTSKYAVGGMNAGKAEAIGAAALSMLGGSKPKKPTQRPSPKAMGKIAGSMANKMFKGKSK